MIRLDRIDAMLLPCLSVWSGSFAKSCRQPKIDYFWEYIYICPIKRPKVTMTAVDRSTALIINLVLHQMSSLDKVEENILILEAHQDICQL